MTCLQILPSTMQELVGLIRIDLSHNQLRDVSMLSSLSDCDIADWSYNELQSLPDDIERMKSLVVLNVSNNQVTRACFYPYSLYAALIQCIFVISSLKM
jgi:Leucine-rich repeat (LRR) protein